VIGQIHALPRAIGIFAHWDGTHDLPALTAEGFEASRIKNREQKRNGTDKEQVDHAWHVHNLIKSNNPSAY
jgi:hypothetical protein